MSLRILVILVAVGMMATLGTKLFSVAMAIDAKRSAMLVHY